MEDVKTVETQNTQVETQETTTKPEVSVDAHTNEQVQETPQKNKPTEVLRDLSKLLSVNLFEDVDAVKKVTDHLDGLKTEKATLQEQYDQAIKERESFTAKEQEYQTKIEALGLGFKADNLDEVLALARVNVKEGQTISDGLKVVRQKYGAMLVASDIGLQHNDVQGDQPDIARTEQERYLEQSKAVQAWRKAQAK